MTETVTINRVIHPAIRVLIAVYSGVISAVTLLTLYILSVFVSNYLNGTNRNLRLWIFRFSYPHSSALFWRETFWLGFVIVFAVAALLLMLKSFVLKPDVRWTIEPAQIRREQSIWTRRELTTWPRSEVAAVSVELRNAWGAKIWFVQLALKNGQLLHLTAPNRDEADATAQRISDVLALGDNHG